MRFPQPRVFSLVRHKHQVHLVFFAVGFLRGAWDKMIGRWVDGWLVNRSFLFSMYHDRAMTHRKLAQEPKSLFSVRFCH